MTNLEIAPEPFDDSRRLTGCNVYFSGTGAALETRGELAGDGAAIERWHVHIALARDALGWPDDDIVARRHRSGTSLAFTAPMDQLYAATEVNEWAWWSAVAAVTAGDGASAFSLRAPSPGGRRETQEQRQARHDLVFSPGHAAVSDVDSALHTLQAVSSAEANPALVALYTEAVARGLPCLPDDDALSIGGGSGSQTWVVDALPAPADVDWPLLHPIPTALITGSNGKTTTVRLVAAMSRAHGWRTGHSCTDGVFFDGDALESGDFSGPTGARTVLRHPDVQAAVLETARGGMLRRGLALCHVDAAVVTNISVDHFGEYGVHDLDDLAAAKLTVARAVHDDGLLVLNADDAVLVRQAGALTCPRGWFSLDYDAPRLAAHRNAGGATSGVRDGRLVLFFEGREHEVGAVDAMPLSMGGRAAYNVANIAAAALVASAMGVPAATIASTLATFGSEHGDNPGRLQHWRLGGIDVYLDYAHNQDGLRGLLAAVGAETRKGRLAILLGHAGNREDADLRVVAETAASAGPDLVVLKDIGGYERGRESGEVAAIMHTALLDAGIDASNIETCLDEVLAARRPLEWARDGDLVVLPVHELDARASVASLLDALRADGWAPGSPLPPFDGAAS